MNTSFPMTRRTIGLSSVALLVASLVCAPLQAQAQSRKDTVTLGMILEPTSLGPGCCSAPPRQWPQPGPWSGPGWWAPESCPGSRCPCAIEPAPAQAHKPG